MCPDHTHGICDPEQLSVEDAREMDAEGSERGMKKEGCALTTL